MRTTLDIDEDVLLAATDIARRRGASVGRVLSELARQALAHVEGSQERNGLPLFPRQPGARMATRELINRLRDEGA